MNIQKVYLLSLLILIGIPGISQDPLRYQEEVDNIVSRDADFLPTKNLILFTGSSSIRLWKNLAESFPDKNIINTGFGGSHTSDLIYFSNELIFQYKPSQIFIYEGDNDLADLKTPQQIFQDSKNLITKIQKALPNTSIVFISPKPSILRWSLKQSYEEYNHLLQQFISNNPNITFVNVWPAMLDSNGNPREDIYVEDNLHMNEKGYEIWAEIIKPYLK